MKRVIRLTESTLRNYVFEAIQQERLKQYIKNMISEEVNHLIKEDSKENEKRKALAALNDPRFDRSEIMRSVKPGMNDDTLRSLGSKMARGERPISPEDAIVINQQVRKKTGSGV